MSFVQKTRPPTCFVIRQLSLDNVKNNQHAEFRARAKTSPLANLHAQLVFFPLPIYEWKESNCLPWEISQCLKLIDNTRRKAAQGSSLLNRARIKYFLMTRYLGWH